VAGASRALFERVHGASHAAADSVPASARERLWDAAVGVLAWSLRDWSSYQRLGRVVEATAPRLPQSVGARVVALATEAAGRAGRLHGPADLSTLTTQKGRELARERQAPEPRASG
jgi:hypothetical protein